MAEAYGGAGGFGGFRGGGGSVNAMGGGFGHDLKIPNGSGQITANLWQQLMPGQPVPAWSRGTPWGQLLMQQLQQRRMQQPAITPPMQPTQPQMPSKWLDVPGPSSYGVQVPQYGYFPGKGQPRSLIMGGL